MKKIRKECAVVKNVNTQNWKSKSSALIKIKASPSSEVGTITVNYLVSRLKYEKIIWRKL